MEAALVSDRKNTQTPDHVIKMTYGKCEGHVKGHDDAKEKSALPLFLTKSVKKYPGRLKTKEFRLILNENR